MVMVYHAVLWIQMTGSVTMWISKAIYHISEEAQTDHLEDACRFADQDILMRYHWSLGIGHTYSYSHKGTHPGTHPSHLDHNTPQVPRADSDVFELDVRPDVEVPTCLEEPENAENLELCLEYCEDDLDGESDYSSDEEDREDLDGETLEAMEIFGLVDDFA